MKLQHKFFLAFFVTNLGIVILLLAAIALSLSSDFNDFVNEAEAEHVLDSIVQLGAVYQRSNSWQPIINDVQIWRDIVDPRQSPPRGGPHNKRLDRAAQPQDKRIQQPSAPNRGAQQNRPPRAKSSRDKSADFLKTGQRMSLYDSHKRVIVGRKELEQHQRIAAISVAGKTVGWIGLASSNAVENSPASEFLKQQHKTYLLIAIAVILLAIFMALVLTKHLVAPIKRLIKATSKLRRGDYSSRVNKSSNDEIGTLSDNFNELANILEKNQHNRRQWMSDTSHELRTPLTVIKSQLFAIQDGVFQASPAKLSMLIEEVDKLSRIVDDLYQLSSSDVGGLTYKKAIVDPISLLNQSLDIFQSKFKQQALTVSRTAGDRSQCTLFADKDRLLQLFSNLLENSCRYTHRGGNINIDTQRVGQQLQIQIQDSSPGVSEADKAKIFERFYRVEQSRSRAHGGSGLGLALCSQIVAAHQGSIKAQDSPLGGLSIIITLPIHLGAEQG